VPPFEKYDNYDIHSLLNCLEELRCWLAANFLTLNDSKTEIVVFGPPASIIQINNHLDHLTGNSHAHAKNLGVIFDNSLKFKQINSVVAYHQSGFYHLRCYKIKSFFNH